MPCTLNKKAWEKLIDEDVEWLDWQPDTLECKHIRHILEWVKIHRPIETQKLRERIKERIKELEAVIEAALRISDLWTLKEVESMFEDEAKALEIMKKGFEQALKEKP